MPENYDIIPKAPVAPSMLPRATALKLEDLLVLTQPGNPIGQKSCSLTLDMLRSFVWEDYKGFKVVDGSNITSAKIVEIFESGNVPVIRFGGGEQGNFTALYAFPTEIYKSSDNYRRCIFYRFDEVTDNDNVVHRKLYWYKYENIPTAGGGEQHEYGEIDLTHISPDQIEMINGTNKFSVKYQNGKYVVSVDGDFSISGSISLTKGSSTPFMNNERINVLDANGHHIGAVRTNMMPDVVMTENIESFGFLLIDQATVDDYYAGREFVVFNNTDSDKHVRIFMVKKGSDGYEFVSDASAGVYGHKVMNVTVPPYCCRKIVYAGIYDAQHNNEGGFFALE